MKRTISRGAISILAAMTISTSVLALDCDMYKEASQTIMEERQQDVIPRDDAVREAMKVPDIFIVKLVVEAYSFPVMLIEEHKVVVSLMFAEEIYQECKRSI